MDRINNLRLVWRAVSSAVPKHRSINLFVPIVAVCFANIAFLAVIARLSLTIIVPGVVSQVFPGANMQRNFPWWSILGIVLVLVCIAGYNYWAYSCGYCAIQDMKSVGPQVKAVGSLVLGASVCWLLLFFKRSFSQPSNSCRCGRYTISDWSYCPDCGHQIK